MTGLALGVGLILLGGLSSIVLRRWATLSDQVYSVLLVAGAVSGMMAAIRVIAGIGTEVVSLGGGLPGGRWVFALDPLSSWFVLAILSVGAAAAVFGVRYLAPERPHRNVALAHLWFALLLAGLVGVVTAHAVAPFLASWEVMALSAYLLVIYESERPEIRRAGLIYIVLTHLSTLALIGMFAALMVHATEPTFAAIAAGARVRGGEGTLALALGLVGFGVKAGVVPVHFWLPGAHAAAPSHVSAVLSGVMLKTGIYGLLRLLTFFLLPPAWFGWTLLGLGLVSGILGVLWALRQHDLKRLLAYHSVENIGIILIGMGVGTLGVVYRRPEVAALGFMGAVLHTLNHALFKSLLFLGAGAVLRATGIRLIDQLGGLWRRVPLVALAFGIGSIAIVGLPPLNGFVSEWLVFGGLLRAAGPTAPLRFAVLGVAGLGLIGGLALACFTKIDGIIFLGQPRAPREVEGGTTNPGPGMIGPMLALASGCLLIGMWPTMVMGPIARVAAQVLHGADPGLAAGPWIESAGRLSVLAGGFLLGVVALVTLRALVTRRREHPVVDTWACAGLPLTPRMQYSASSYAAPLLSAFAPLAGVRSTWSPASAHTQSEDPIQDRAVIPAWRRVRAVSQRFRTWQGARIRWYLLSVVVTLLVLLFRLAGWTAVP